MGTTHESAFLAEITERPDDDNVRLVYADWLEENGDPDRAEFIRLQCGPDRDDPAITKRVDKLLKTNRKKWEAPFEALKADIGFDRGFPYFLKADIRLLAEHADLLALAPAWCLQVQRLAYDSDDEDGDDWDAPRIEPYARLGASPFVGHIRTLNFSWSWIHPEEVAAVLTPSMVAAVRELRFGDDGDKRGILKQVLSVPKLRLESLAFMGDTAPGIGDAGCRMIAAARKLAGLRELKLSNNGIGPAGVAALAESRHVRKLVHLNLESGSHQQNKIGPAGARHLAESNSFHHLESLNLVYNFIGDAGLAALAESSRLRALRTLYLPGNGIGDDGLRALARSSGLPALDWLNIEGVRNVITASGIRELAASPRMARLTGLMLDRNKIGDEGAAALADAPGASGLRDLQVDLCGISRDGFVRMLESPYLAGIRDFSLSGSGNPVSADDVSKLKARYGKRVR